jgi:TRAP-type C4-dicarboxylate transport system permease small subunit
MNAIHRAMQLLARVLEIFITLCFFTILSLTVVLVVLRYGFNASIMGGNELVEYLFIYTTAVGAAAALAKREHIKITWFVDKLAPLARRIVDTVAFLLIGFVNAVMIYYSVPWIRAVGSFESPVLRLPNRSIQLIVPIGCGLVILYCVYHAFLVLSGSSEGRERPSE